MASLKNIDKIRDEVNLFNFEDLQNHKEIYYKEALHTSLEINRYIEKYGRIPKEYLKALELNVEYLLNIQQRLDGKTGNWYRVKKRWALANHFRQNFRGNF